MCSNFQVEDNHLKLRDVINIVQSVLHRWNLFVKLSWVTLSYWLWFSGALSHYPWGTTTGTFAMQLFKANFCCSACVNLESSSPTHTSIPQFHTSTLNKYTINLIIHRYLVHYLKSLKDWMSAEVWAKYPVAKVSWSLLQVKSSTNLINSTNGIHEDFTGLVPWPKSVGAWSQSDCNCLHTTGTGDFWNSGANFQYSFENRKRRFFSWVFFQCWWSTSVLQYWFISCKYHLQNY